MTGIHPPDILDMEAGTKWIEAVASVIFDVDTGQRIDSIYPQGACTEDELQALAFHSFPDSMSIELHAKTSVRDTCFWFRVKRSSHARAVSEPPGPCPKGAPQLDKFLYGYVFCRQRQDETLRRGGEQVSVVVLSEHPFSSCLRPLSQVAGPMVLSSPVPAAALRQVYMEVCAWPAPTAAGLMQLQVNFNTISGRLPPFNTLPHPSCGQAVDLGFSPARSATLAKTVVDQLAVLTDLTGGGSRPRTHSGSMLDNVSNSGSGLLASAAGISRLSRNGGGSVSQPAESSATLQGVRRSSSDLPEQGPESGNARASSTGSSDRRNSASQLGTMLGVVVPLEDRTNGQSANEGEGGGDNTSQLPQAPASTKPNSLHTVRIPSPSAPASEVSPAPGSGNLFGLPPLKTLRTGDHSALTTMQSYSPTMWAGHVPSSLHQHVTLRSVSRASIHSVDSQGSVQTGGVLEAVGARLTATSQPSPSHSLGNLQTLQGASSEPLSLPSNGSLRPPSAPQVGSPAVQLQASLSGAMPRRLSTSLLGDLGGVAGGAFCDADVFTPMQPHLSRLWHLWELVLLAKPLLVVGPSPADCSGAVAALISLVAPLPYAPDFRPYYTIHDSAFAALAGGALPGPQQRSVPCLMGVTNLYFVKALTSWPNILSVGRKETGNSWAPDAPVASTAMAAFTSAAGAVRAMRQRAQGAQALLGEHIESMWSSYRPVTRPDETLLVRLLQPRAGDAKSKLARIAAVNSEALRRHFQELMIAFLLPFARYFEPGVDGWLPAWDEAEFLFTVRAPATPVPPVLMDRVGGLIGNLVELYARFVSSVNFRDWFALHRRPLQHLEAPILAPQLSGPSAKSQGLAWFGKASQHLPEVQLIHMYSALEQQLREAQAEADSPDAEPEALATKQRLQSEICTLFLGIGQEDLQLLCISAPSRRDLLLSAAQAACTPPNLARIKQLSDMLGA